MPPELTEWSIGNDFEDDDEHASLLQGRDSAFIAGSSDTLYKAKKYGKKAVKFTTEKIIPGVGSILSATSAAKTHLHIVKLKQLQDFFPCSCAESKCDFDLIFVLNKKARKRIKKGFGVIPFVGLVVTAASVARAGYKLVKGSKGVRRKEVARRLWMASNDSGSISACPKAFSIVRELVGDSSCDSVIRNAKGYNIIADKISS